MITIPWSRVFIIVSFVALGVLAFDLQLAPALNKVAKNIRSQLEKKEAEEVLPEPIEAQGPLEDLGAKSGDVLVPQSNSVAIVVNSEPAGAILIFNGKVVGTTPFEGSATVGEKLALSLSLQGYFPDSRELTPESGKDIKISFQLKPLSETPVGAQAEAESPPTTVPQASKPQKLVEPLNTDDLVEAQVRQELKSHAKKEKVSLPAMPEVKDRFFTVQIESLDSQQEASYRAALYQSMGLPAFVCRADMGEKGTWFRVRVGELNTKPEAEKLATKLGPDIKSKPWIVHEDGLCPKLLSATPWEL